MAIKKRSFSVTTAGDGTGEVDFSAGAKYVRVLQFVIDDSASTEAAVVFTLEDARGRVIMVTDALDVSEGPFYKQPTTDTSDDSDDNEATAGYGVPAQGPFTVSVASGGASLTYTGYVLAEVN